MASGFTRNKATSILTGNIKSSTYICLSASTPDENGNNFSEPPTSAGYVRKQIGTLDTSIKAQVANKDYIFIFEASEDCGSVTHVGLSDSEDRGGPVFLMGKLSNAITVGAGYVPLIRPWKLKIGLDKDVLETYPNET